MAKKLQLIILSLLCVVGTGHTAEPTFFPSTNGVGTPLRSTHVHNLFRAITNVFSGSSPDTDAAFAEIARLGVKTIISVDGGKPDVDGARKHGLRYIHLPIGYDGVPTNRVAELARAAQTAVGPLYVHCHHGLHRGPAAVAVMCQAIGGWTTNQAVMWLKQAGTSTDYTGLYRSVMEFRAPARDTIAGIIELPEITRTPSLVEAMVAIDADYESLKAAQRTGWRAIPSQPNIVPAQAATVLWEHFKELARLEDTAHRPDDYRAKLAASEKASGQVRTLLHDPAAATGARDSAFKALGQTCSACHKTFRN